MPLSAFRAARAAAGRRASRRLPRRASPAPAATSTTASSRTTSSTGRRSASSEGVVPQPDDVAARGASPPSSRDLAARRIRAGEWPWSFFCYPEERPRPVFPSLVLRCSRPADGLARPRRRAARPARASSVNLVSHEHVDVPFHNDREVGVVAHVFADDARADARGVPRRALLGAFDARRLDLG